jgi:hypothetical protein
VVIEKRRPHGSTGSGEAIAFTAILLVTTLAFLAATTGLHPSTALVPRVIGWPLAVLLSYLLMREVGARGRRLAAAPDERVTRQTDEISAILWLLGLPVLSTILGFVAGPALYVFGWARLRGGERIGIAIAAGAFTACAIQVLFAWLLGVRLPQGILGALF